VGLAREENNQMARYFIIEEVSFGMMETRYEVYDLYEDKKQAMQELQLVKARHIGRRYVLAKEEKK
jgi:hypothetical protein